MLKQICKLSISTKIKVKIFLQEASESRTRAEPGYICNITIDKSIYQSAWGDASTQFLSMHFHPVYTWQRAGVLTTSHGINLSSKRSQLLTKQNKWLMDTAGKEVNEESYSWSTASWIDKGGYKSKKNNIKSYQKLASVYSIVYIKGWQVYIGQFVCFCFWLSLPLQG